MTAYVTFQPSSQAPFQFNATLDGQPYVVVVKWNLFGQRYYIQVQKTDGTPVINLPLIGSPPGKVIGAMSFDILTNLVTITTTLPHNLKIGWTYAVTISGCSPDDYNGAFRAFPINKTQLRVPLAGFHTQPTAFGFVFTDISLTAGYFASTLVFRQQNQQFEINP